jgi:hypothetical protein
VGSSFTVCSSGALVGLQRPPPPFSRPSAATGVGSNGENPVTAVRGADGGSRYAVPRHVIPERGQVADHGSPDRSPMNSEDRGHVLHQHESGPKLANDSLELGPQRSLRVSETSPLPGGRCSLTREAAGDAVDGLEVVRADGPDVIVNRAPWESPREQPAAELVTLDKPGMLEPGLMEPDIEKPGP